MGVIAGPGVWPRAFAPRAGRFGASAVAALVLGFGRAGMGWTAVAATTLLGLGPGAILVFQRSIWPAAFAHGCFNAASFAMLSWMMERN